MRQQHRENEHGLRHEHEQAVKKVQTRENARESSSCERSPVEMTAAEEEVVEQHDEHERGHEQQQQR